MPAKSTKTGQPDWPHHIQALYDSGLSRAEYYRQTGLDYDQFGFYWRKLRDDSATTQLDGAADINDRYEASDFVPIVLPNRTQNLKSEFTLTQTDGSTLSWSAD
jgi:hypothetical protein